MTKEVLREQIFRSPFRPFAIRLIDGRVCEVPSADHVSISPGGRTLVVYMGEDGESVRLIDVTLVLEIEAASQDGKETGGQR
jgi:hypothetical protein